MILIEGFIVFDRRKTSFKKEKQIIAELKKLGVNVRPDEFLHGAML